MLTMRISADDVQMTYVPADDVQMMYTPADDVQTMCGWHMSSTSQISNQGLTLVLSRTSSAGCPHIVYMRLQFPDNFQSKSRDSSANKKANRSFFQ